MYGQTSSSHDAGVTQAQAFLPHYFQNQDLLRNALIAADSNRDDRDGHRSLAQLGDQLIGFVLMSEGYDRGLSRRKSDFS